MAILMSLEAGKPNSVQAFFDQKLKEGGEKGEVLARYTIGADLGFVRDRWRGKKRAVVFEVNGQNAGLTIPKNKLKPPSPTEGAYNLD